MPFTCIVFFYQSSCLLLLRAHFSSYWTFISAESMIADLCFFNEKLNNSTEISDGAIEKAKLVYFTIAMEVVFKSLNMICFGTISKLKPNYPTSPFQTLSLFASF